jgi:capsular polysaccharide biosynthesis protein
LSDYIVRLRRRGPLVLGITLLVTVVALAISLSKPKQYDASATLLFPQTQPLDALAIPGQTLPQPVDPERETNTNVALATLQPVADRVKARLHLAAPARDLLAHVSASAVGTSDLVTITAHEPDPVQAAHLANAFALEYVQFRRDTANASLAQAAQSIAAQLDGLSSAGRSSPTGVALATRLAAIQSAQAVQTGGAQVVRSATAPTSAASPHPKTTSILALVLGLAFAIAIALGLDLVDRRLKDEEQIEAAFGLPILATLSSVKYGRSPLNPLQLDGARLLAANLRRAGLEEGTLLISGTGREDGQTAIALVLAQALAQLGEAVAVIDTDPASPTIAHMLELPVGDGDGAQSGAALGNIEIEADTMRPVAADDLALGPRFLVLSGGPGSLPDSTAIPGAGLRELRSTAAATANIILVPTATIERGLALAEDAEGILVVAQRNRTTRDAAAGAAKLLRNAYMRAYGVVVTDAGARVQTRGEPQASPRRQTEPETPLTA